MCRRWVRQANRVPFRFARDFPQVQSATGAGAASSNLFAGAPRLALMTFPMAAAARGRATSVAAAR